jgi:hypothetical protein
MLVPSLADLARILAQLLRFHFSAFPRLMIALRSLRLCVIFFFCKVDQPTMAA